MATAIVVGVGVLMLWRDGLPAGGIPRSTPAGVVPIAVIGDSGSHSYQDHISFPADSRERGGRLRARTFQWTEVLQQLRSKEIDLGPWVTWGRPGLVALGREWIGLQGGRSPEKEDFLYNFANSGASCKNIMGTNWGQRYRQVPRLVALMNQEPELWRRGVVVIAIGSNDWSALLDLQARDPTAPKLSEVIRFCKDQITAAIDLIHASHPSTRVLIVGVGNEADDPMNADRFRGAAATENLKIALDRMNGELRQITQAEPKRIAFLDYNAWFVAHWGERGPNGEPDYKTVILGPTIRITNTAGDEPSNALLGDHHAGLLFNALWAQTLVQRLRDAFGLPLTPIGDDEIRGLVSP
jgi:hypothetical protein